MPPKKGPSTPNKPPENPNWTLDEGEEMRRDINELQKKMDSMEAKLLRWIQWKLRSWKY
jgi:hypothetical protein